MLEEHVLDMEGAYGEMWAMSRRCVNCGHVQDSVIEQHRLARPEPLAGRSCGESDYQDDEANLGTASIIRRAA